MKNKKSGLPDWLENDWLENGNVKDDLPEWNEDDDALFGDDSPFAIEMQQCVGGTDEWEIFAGESDILLMLNDTAAGDIIVPDTLKVDGEKLKVKTIGMRMNYSSQQTLLTGVSGGKWLKTVDDYAFANCIALKSVSFPNAESVDGLTFTNCVSLTSVSLPNVRDIKWLAFSGCTALESLSFPKLKTVATGAFSGCTALKSLTFGKFFPLDATDAGLPKTALTLTVPASSHDAWLAWAEETNKKGFTITVVAK